MLEHACLHCLARYRLTPVLHSSKQPKLSPSQTCTCRSANLEGRHFPVLQPTVQQQDQAHPNQRDAKPKMSRSLISSQRTAHKQTLQPGKPRDMHTQYKNAPMQSKTFRHTKPSHTVPEANKGGSQVCSTPSQTTHSAGNCRH